MSSYENGDQAVGQKSSIEIAQTAKGDPVVKVKVYADTPADELDRIRMVAVSAYRETVAAVKAPA